MSVRVQSIVDVGLAGIEVDVECHLSRGLPTVTIVGLAGKAVDEAKERIRVAISATGLEFPRKRIIINLAPAELQKDAVSLDLAMAIAILQADSQITAPLTNYVFIGELGLDGAVRPVRGLIGKLLSKRCRQAAAVFVPKENEDQAALTGLSNIYPVETLVSLLQHLSGAKDIEQLTPVAYKPLGNSPEAIDLAEVQDQAAAKRALTIAAAGGHNILMSGPPGTGKSMLAKAFIGILPPLTREQALETTHLHSLATKNYDTILQNPPLRTPHHTASDVALIGGGHALRPGEISLAHNGVLFLDELPEFHRYAIESLRQPLEDGIITIARAQQSVTFPSRFICIATSNPCPCGYYGSDKPCTCSASQIMKYQKKLSGPIIDRIDLHVTVGQVAHEKLLANTDKLESPAIRKTVIAAQQRQITRQNGVLNSHLSNKLLKAHAQLQASAEELLNKAAKELDLSARSYMRTLKLARTIADLDQNDAIEPMHIAEALQYRPKTFTL